MSDSSTSPPEVLADTLTDKPEHDATITATSETEPSISIKITFLCASGVKVDLELTSTLLESYKQSTTGPDRLTVLSLKQLICSVVADPPSPDTSSDKQQSVWISRLVSELQPPPDTPAQIRLIHFGKVLEDEQLLSDYNIGSATSSGSIVHLWVKPSDLDIDDSTKQQKDLTKRKPRAPRGAATEIVRQDDQTTSNRCCVIC